jgi:hypothetical protein
VNKYLRVLFAVLTLALFTVLGYLGYLYSKSSNVQLPLTPQVSETPSSAPTTQYSGKIACLPLKKGAEPEDVTCTLGLLTADGKYYALLNPDPKAPTFNENDKVVVTGSVNNNFVNENQTYEVAGAIDVSTINKR